MTTPDTTAALLQMITQQGERIATLENRAGNLRNTLASMNDTIAKLASTVDTLNESNERLAAQVAGLLPPPDAEPDRGYTPRPSVRWWSIKDDERRKEAERLAEWVEKVYRPCYGHLAATLAGCWEQHPLILVQLDWLSELHSVLHRQSKRNASLLPSQAEFATRILPAVSEQFRAETSRCKHGGAGNWRQTG